MTLTWLHYVYWIGCAVGILMFGAAWLIRRRQITEGPLARAEKPLMLGGAAVAFVFAMLGMIAL